MTTSMPVLRNDPEHVSRLEEAWRQARPLHESLPVTFEGEGTCKLEEFAGCCSVCGEKIPPNDLRGTVSFPIESVAVINASGICRPCRCITQFMRRIRNTPEGLQSEWVRGNGQWVKRLWRPAASPVLGWLVRFVRLCTNTH